VGRGVHLRNQKLGRALFNEVYVLTGRILVYCFSLYFLYCIVLQCIDFVLYCIVFFILLEVLYCTVFHVIIYGTLAALL